MRAELVEGAGNRFVLLDRFEHGPLEDPVELARRVCAEARADGLLLLGRPSDPRRAEVSMRIHNADGSRAEACGNGLRCLAASARELGHVGRDELVVECDGGARRVELSRRAGRVVAARAEMGPATILAEALEVCVEPARRVLGALVRVGNPHFVLCVDDERSADVRALGSALERRPEFPEGVNVGFLARRDGRLHLRVWERGVGETRACGSGACAAALVARARGWTRLPATVRMAGGELEVGLDVRGEPWLRGPVRRIGTLELSARESRAAP